MCFCYTDSWHAHHQDQTLKLLHKHTFGWLQLCHQPLLVGLNLPDLAHAIAANRRQQLKPRVLLLLLLLLLLVLHDCCCC
jgi:hypothetical protein